VGTTGGERASAVDAESVAMAASRARKQKARVRRADFTNSSFGEGSIRLSAAENEKGLTSLK
jgi:hypothetical protein